MSSNGPVFGDIILNTIEQVTCAHWACGQAGAPLDDAMKITAIETLRLREYGNLIWVVIGTDQGLEGLGETFMWPAPVEAHIHETIAPYLLGKNPLLIDAHWKHLYGYLGFSK